MGRIFRSGYAAATASTSAKELGQLLGGSSNISILHEVLVTNRTTVSAMIDYTICFAGTTGVVGTTQALTNLGLGESAPAGNFYGVAGSTNATGLTIIHRETVNTLNGFHYLPTPELRPYLKPGGRIVIRREYSTEDYSCDMQIAWEEIG